VKERLKEKRERERRNERRAAKLSFIPFWWSRERERERERERYENDTIRNEII
jgi:hypothetical protein